MSLVYQSASSNISGVWEAGNLATSRLDGEDWIAPGVLDFELDNVNGRDGWNLRGFSQRVNLFCVWRKDWTRVFGWTKEGIVAEMLVCSISVAAVTKYHKFSAKDKEIMILQSYRSEVPTCLATALRLRCSFWRVWGKIRSLAFSSF